MMMVEGVILRVQRDRAEMTLIIQTNMGLRGVSLEADLWAEIARDFELGHPDEMEGWTVAYDPAHGDLEITAPGTDSPVE